MMTKEGYTQIINLMTSGAGVPALGCGHISHKVKCKIRQTIYIVMINNEGSNKIVNFMILEQGSYARVLLYMSYSENALFL